MRSTAAGLAAAAACVGLVLVVVYERHGTSVALEQQDSSMMNQEMERRIEQDERRLMQDVRLQQQMLRVESKKQQLAPRAYDDGCKCECPPGGCDEEMHQGPVCTCPEESGMPEPFAPFNFDASAARRRHGMPMHTRNARAEPQQDPARMQQAWRLKDKLGKNGLPIFPPFFPSSEKTLPAPHREEHARFQQKWVGSPQKMLPPDGDYPGGQTGIPLDGYLAYETGWANDGPFHGELAPMQEAGIANKALPRHQILSSHFQRRHMRKPRLGQEEFGSSFDQRVPAAAIDRDLFTQGMRPAGATVDAVRSAV